MREMLYEIKNNPELLIALMAIIISAVSIGIGFWGVNIQKKHNKKSVRPIGTIDLVDHLDLLIIKLANNGVGPLIIKSITTLKQNEKKGYPIDWMPKDISWATFMKALEEHAIFAGNHLTLLKLDIDLSSTLDKRNRNSAREALKGLEMTVVYTDIYGKEFMVSKSFKWFGRAISEVNAK